MLIAAHHDADGITTAFMVMKGLGYEFGSIGVVFPKVFGDVNDKHDYCLDMSPVDSNYSGIVIDHHRKSKYMKEKGAKYDLIWNNCPAGVIAFERFRDKIPREEWWKVVIASNGDGQAEKTPPYIWDIFPELLDTRAGVYWSSGEGSYITWDMEKYSGLSSMINAYCRVGAHIEALELVFNAKTPEDILEDRRGQLYKKELRKDYKRAKQQAGKKFPNPIIIDNRFLLVRYRSDTRISGVVGMQFNELFGENKYTVIAMNTKKKKFSVRGKYGDLVLHRLAAVGFQVGGHAGFGAGTLGNRTVTQFIDALRTPCPEPLNYLGA